MVHGGDGHSKRAREEERAGAREENRHEVIEVLLLMHEGEELEELEIGEEEEAREGETTRLHECVDRDLDLSKIPE